MVWRGWERDPKADRASSEVQAAYQAAVRVRLPSVDCYRAGVEAWRRVHPEQKPAYAAKQAVAVILGTREKSLLRVE
jgi:hypothetical protein